MDAQACLERIRATPRVGWVGHPTPVEGCPGWAGEAGLAWLGFKRDDRLPALLGGTKVRKLDHLLAHPPWRDAPTWRAAGAMGSGQLVAAALAAEALGRRLEVATCWQPPVGVVLDHLAHLATHADRIDYRATRAGMVLAHPPLAWGGAGRADRPWIPLGATCPPALLGMVAAGLELAVQVEAGVLPAPERVLLPLGTGGTAVGLAAGLALAGLACPVHAVAVVERPLATRSRLARLGRRLAAWMADCDLPTGQVRVVEGAVEREPEPGVVLIDRRWLGRGYGRPTEAALRAVERARALGVPAEPVYLGKALASLDALRGRRVLVWVTPRGGALPPPVADWRERLPRRLRRRLARDEADRGRRRLLAGAGAALLGGACGVRLATRPALRGPWTGGLSAAQAATLLAGAEALLAAEGEAGLRPDPAALREAVAVAAAFVAAMPPATRRELSAGLTVLEEFAPLARGSLRRFSRLAPAERRELLHALHRRGGLPRQLARAVRDLAMLGWYGREASWRAIGYDGPPAGFRGRNRVRYEELVAPSWDDLPAWAVA